MESDAGQMAIVPTLPPDPKALLPKTAGKAKSKADSCSKSQVDQGAETDPDTNVEHASEIGF